MSKGLIKKPTPENRTCIITGDPIIWSGYGRPPKYSERGAKIAVQLQRKARREQRQLAEKVGAAVA